MWFLIFEPCGLIENNVYETLSRRIQLSRASGVLTTTYTYDAINRLLQVFHDAPGAMTPEAQALAELPELMTEAVDALEASGKDSQSLVDSTIAYSYDEVGNRKDRTDTSGLHLYTYDALDQLTGANYPEGFAVGDTTYTYDAVGNRTLVNTTPYTPNSLNQYTQVGPTPVTWSPNGNLTDDGPNTYTYDSENRLTSATPASGSVSFTYDPFGRRLSKTTPTGTTRFLYDGDQLIADTTSTGSITQLYLYGPGIDEPLLMTRGSQRYFYLADGLGSITSLTNLQGQTAEAYTYDVYGRPLQPSTLGNRFRFTGREYDSETQLYYYRARYYHPTIGRFLQRDIFNWGPNDIRALEFSNVFPLWVVATISHSTPPSAAVIIKRLLLNRGLRNTWVDHLYLYTFNNPINFIDPLGFWGFGATIGGTGEIGSGREGEGAAGTVSGGTAVFIGDTGVSLGSYTSLGGFTKDTMKAGESAFGLFIGGGIGFFLTNADSAEQLNQTIWTTSFDIGVIAKFSIQISQGDDIWMGSFSLGPGALFGTSTVETQTEGTTFWGPWWSPGDSSKKK